MRRAKPRQDSGRPTAESDEWFTPPYVFEPIHRELRFTVDVAATKESAKVPRFYTQADDGVAKRWAGERVWCNPPYSNIGAWVAKADVEMRLPSDHLPPQLIAMLLPASKTEQPWWQERVEPYRDLANTHERAHGRIWRYSDTRLFRPFELESRFLAGRIPFGFPGQPEGGQGGSGFFASVLLVWRRVTVGVGK